MLSSLLVALTLFSPAVGAAQEETPVEPADPNANASIVMTSPNQPTSSPEAWLQHDLEDADARIRRSRNALIATSATVAVGAILMGAAATQCEVFRNSLTGYDDLRCNSAGNALLGTGGAFVGLGAIGMITSGIILGVANKRKREIKRDIRRGYYGRRLQWDVPSGGLVF